MLSRPAPEFLCTNYPIQAFEQWEGKFPSSRAPTLSRQLRLFFDLGQADQRWSKFAANEFVKGICRRLTLFVCLILLTTP